MLPVSPAAFAADVHAEAGKQGLVQAVAVAAALAAVGEAAVLAGVPELYLLHIQACLKSVKHVAPSKPQYSLCGPICTRATRRLCCWCQCKEDA